MSFVFQFMQDWPDPAATRDEYTVVAYNDHAPVDSDFDNSFLVPSTHVCWWAIWTPGDVFTNSYGYQQRKFLKHTVMGGGTHEMIFDDEGVARDFATMLNAARQVNQRDSVLVMSSSPFATPPGRTGQQQPRPTPPEEVYRRIRPNI